MTALDRITVRGLGIPGVPIDIVKRIAGEAIWKWYDEHKEEVIFEKKVWFFNVKLKIKDLEFLIARIAGPRKTSL